MFIITQLTQSWYRRTMHLNVLHVSTCYGHNQIHGVLTITLYLLYLPTLASV
jgi:hypothetical protein